MPALPAPRRFAFLVHPLVPLARALYALRTGRPGLLLGLRDGTDPDDVSIIARLHFAGVEGLIVGVPMLPAQLLDDQERALRSMVRAVQIAQPVSCVGLGSVLSVVAGRGSALQTATGIPVTTGNAATAWAAWRVTEAVRGDRKVAVLGAKGTVGRALVALTGGDAEPEDLRDYGVIVGAHTTGGVLDPARVSAGTTLVDVALPATLSGPAPGVRVVPGESLELPAGWRRDPWGWVFHLVAGYGLGRVYACLIEPLIAVLETRATPWAQGRALDAQVVRQFGAAAEARGFRPVLPR
jgi:predicted amino acid dehydrogenase